MSDLTMVERAALGIYGATEWRPETAEIIRNACRRNARAAIAAMRDPSEAMIREGFCTGPDDDAVVVWRTMIDAALKEVGHD
jgi:hypothetical protein